MIRLSDFYNCGIIIIMVLYPHGSYIPCYSVRNAEVHKPNKLGRPIPNKLGLYRSFLKLKDALQ